MGATSPATSIARSNLFTTWRGSSPPARTPPPSTSTASHMSISRELSLRQDTQGGLQTLPVRQFVRLQRRLDGTRDVLGLIRSDGRNRHREFEHGLTGSGQRELRASSGRSAGEWFTATKEIFACPVPLSIRRTPVTSMYLANGCALTASGVSRHPASPKRRRARFLSRRRAGERKHTEWPARQRCPRQTKRNERRRQGTPSVSGQSARTRGGSGAITGCGGAVTTGEATGS